VTRGAKRSAWLWGVAVVVLLLAGAEALLRSRAAHVVPRDGGTVELNADLLVRYTPRGKRLVPNARVVVRHHTTSGLDVPIDINSLGLRDTELAQPKGADEWRVLVLGDSITWADYLPADETFVERAEAALRARLPERRVNVVNGGIGDTGLREMADLLEEVGEPVAPDVVTVSVYLNDSRPPWGFPAELSDPGWLRRHSLLADTLYRGAKLREWVRRQGGARFAWTGAAQKLAWRSDPAAFHELAGLARYDWGAAWDDASWGTIAEGLDRIGSWCQAHDALLVILGLPVVYQVEADFVEDEPQRRLAALAAERKLPLLDVLPLLRSHRAEPALFYDQCHPRAPANAWIGAALADFLFPLAKPAVG
jgi:lysophospholipase L1-like esterase